MNTVVITGASRGIGKATAEHFLLAGWKVIGTSTNGTGWQHPNLTWFPLDLASTESIEEAANDIRAQGRVDVLVDNAGFLAEEEKDFSVQPLRMDSLRRTLEINLIGTIDLTERLLPIVPSGGHIILLGSQCGSLTGTSTEGSPAYSISKAALSMYARNYLSSLSLRV